MSGQHNNERLVPSALYCIVQSEKGWSIQLNRKDIVTCLTLELATKAAIHSAFRAHRLGYRARVIMHDGRSLRTLWSNGRLPSEPLHRLVVRRPSPRWLDDRIRWWRQMWTGRSWPSLGEPRMA